MGALSFLSGLMNGGSLVKSVGDAIHENVTTDKERLALQNEAARAEQAFTLEEDKLDVQLAVGQQAINLKEAESPQLFVAGWRPFIGWVCGMALVYQFLLYPLLGWLNAWQQFAPTNPPALDMQTLITVLMAMLGMGGFRTFEKLKGVATKGVKGKS